MAKEQKKAKRDNPEEEDDDFLPERGKQEHQKMKAYLVMDYLMRETDEQHHKTIDDIIDYLSECCGINAKNDSIKADIKEINSVLYMLKKGCMIHEAKRIMKQADESEKWIASAPSIDRRCREYYVMQRKNEVTENDARLIVEAIYTARFLSESKASDLVKIVSSLVSKHEAEHIKHDLPALGRPRTTNTSVYNNISLINYAMQTIYYADSHIPEKITFRYQKYSIDNVEKTVDRRNGERYKVSPYKLLIDDGKYYLMAFDDHAQEMRIYRVDRMKDVRLTDEPRDGEAFYDEKNMENFPQRVFGMFTGERVRVTLLFDMRLLDAAIERFGRKDLEYIAVDENIFMVSPEIEVSDHFFAWVCGFRKLVKILEPDNVVEQFKKYLDDIRGEY